jgi:hypothetical protein
MKGIPVPQCEVFIARSIHWKHKGRGVPKFAAHEEACGHQTGECSLLSTQIAQAQEDLPTLTRKQEMTSEHYPGKLAVLEPTHRAIRWVCIPSPSTVRANHFGVSIQQRKSTRFRATETVAVPVGSSLRPAHDHTEVLTYSLGSRDKHDVRHNSRETLLLQIKSWTPL